MTTPITVGLFGTCGGSTWRDNIIAEFEKQNISYFNPVVPNWTEECAAIEARHLANDELLLMAVTDETTAVASLAEVGMIIVNIMLAHGFRELILYIAPKVSEEVKTATPGEAKNSNRARTLLLEHFDQIKGLLPYVYLVNSLEEMCELAVATHKRMIL